MAMALEGKWNEMTKQDKATAVFDSMLGFERHGSWGGLYCTGCKHQASLHSIAWRLDEAKLIQAQRRSQHVKLDGCWICQCSREYHVKD